LNVAEKKQAEPVRPYQPFPVDALPNPVREFVQEAAEAIVCDHSYVALPLFSALAAAIGNTCRIKLKRSWTEPAVLWTAIVGESGTIKGPALDHALRPVREMQEVAIVEYSSATDAFEQKCQDYERDLAEWKHKKQGEPPKKPPKPTLGRFIVSDCTVEALAPILRDNPRGVLMARDELSAWLAGFNQYKGGKGSDVANWLEMHGARSIIIDRKKEPDRFIYVPRAAVSITGSIQPATLASALGRQYFENGLAARLLLAMPVPPPKEWTEAEIDPAMERTINHLFSGLFGIDLAMNSKGQPSPCVIGLSADGKEAWVDFYNAHAREQANLTGDLAAAWSKLECYAARLALVIHLVRWAAGDTTLQSPDAVDAESISSGVRLVEWFGNEDRRVYAVLGESEEQRQQRRLMELMEKKGGTITVRELTHSNKKDYPTADDAEAVLAGLAKPGGPLKREYVPPSAKGGRPSEVFRLSTTSPKPETPKNCGKNEVLGFGDAIEGNDEWGEV